MKDTWWHKCPPPSPAPTSMLTHTQRAFTSFPCASTHLSCSFPAALSEWMDAAIGVLYLRGQVLPYTLLPPSVCACVCVLVLHPSFSLMDRPHFLLRHPCKHTHKNTHTHTRRQPTNTLYSLPDLPLVMRSFALQFFAGEKQLWGKQSLCISCSLLAHTHTHRQGEDMLHGCLYWTGEKVPVFLSTTK